ncbi:dihydrofolate reductase [Pedobacter sp. HDW13]|uniref:dihydrofolate reductase family protein n=1 Tax=unclassified Pedobacter TaxID=2628915 RepID=UPI000F59F1D8|nr:MULTISPECIES: dihydrofolate reductase family protein [unclassified Pedobacter]QIL41660.1 dihydrofolate reductase [Pedobacter sp. HDW13]RQO73561.1 dihydrofolate reductase [Pedobacter sp. KBW01]
MRKIIVLAMISLDGVMQAPGGPEEDTSNGFKYGGWAMKYSDELNAIEVKKELEQRVDYLLGRKTFDIWENYWPEHGDFWPGINSGIKYVLTGTRKESDWENTVFIENLDDIRKIKNSAGADIQVWGSSKLVQLLFKHDLVDELRLKIYPLMLGKGKKLFDSDALPADFTLTARKTTTKGIILANYSKSALPIAIV